MIITEEEYLWYYDVWIPEQNKRSGE